MPLYAVILSNNLAPTRPSTDWLLGVAYWINTAGVAGGVNRRISTNSKTRMIWKGLKQKRLAWARGEWERGRGRGPPPQGLVGVNHLS